MADTSQPTPPRLTAARFDQLKRECGHDPAWPKPRPGCQTGCGVLIGCFREDCPAKAEVAHAGR